MISLTSYYEQNVVTFDWLSVRRQPKTGSKKQPQHKVMFSRTVEPVEWSLDMFDPVIDGFRANTLPD